MALQSPVFVTGATGFVGKALVRELLKQGAVVFALVRTTSNTKPIELDGVTLVTGDLENPDSYLDSLRQCKSVIHCGGYTQAKPWEKLHLLNAVATQRLCQACVECGIGRFVHVSSAAVISANPDEVLTDSHPPAPHDDYARSKHEGEQIVQEYIGKGLDAVILRPCMVYGPGEKHVFGTVAKLIRFHLLWIPGPGRGHWPVVYVDDVASALVAAAAAEGEFEGTYLVGPAKTYSLTEIFDTMADILGVHRPRHLWPFLTRLMILAALAANRLGVIDVSFSRKKDGFFEQNRSYDITRTRSAFGWTPAVDLPEGMANTLAGCGYKTNEQ